MTITLSPELIAGLLITGLAIFGTHYFRYWRQLHKLVAYVIGLGCILAGMTYSAIFGVNAFTIQQVFAFCAVAGVVTVITNLFDERRKMIVAAEAEHDAE